MKTCFIENCSAPTHATYRRCRDHYNEYRRVNKHLQRKAWLKHKYKMTLEGFDRMLAEQGGCGACGTQEPSGTGWCVDHDHSCCPGKRSCGECVRGILCFGCNVVLGCVNDSPERLAQLAAYLIQANVSRMQPI